MLFNCESDSINTQKHVYYFTTGHNGARGINLAPSYRQLHRLTKSLKFCGGRQN